MRAALEDASTELAQAVAESYEDWRPEQLAAVEDSRRDALDALDTLTAALDQLEVERNVLSGLEQMRAEPEPTTSKGLARQRELA